MNTNISIGSHKLTNPPPSCSLGHQVHYLGTEYLVSKSLFNSIFINSCIMYTKYCKILQHCNVQVRRMLAGKIEITYDILVLE